MFIATLIAAESITAADISAAADRIDTAGGTVDRWVWIDDARAADIRFTGDAAAARDALEGSIAATDIAVQPAATRDKALLIADMDSTMITVECIDELADYAGIKPQIAEVTERAMRGELDFASALDARVALLAGLGEDAIQRCLDERVKLMPGAKTLVQTMRARGATTILVSGGFTRFAQPVGQALGFHRMIANRLLIEDGKLTGHVRKPIVDATTKEVTLLAAIDELGIDPAATLAVGDGANDLPMIRRAGLGVAYRAKPIVAAEAAARVDHGDLTALLYMQGISRAEWVQD
ncbi:phosphoserine phosphatase SerB [Sphingomonas sp. CFBP 13720]|uniref:phosphoserine phosphatase SerB n=1 Tax=Sphingomonas sp. CFBP 13720 TaxID=2775302 RepID=UPI00177EBBC5|nr:phosphoserine phosphatase SerB [Sphingomonas sp. CFBP 13720]MBD8677029.1 phosphoserine phosphatase SerB [Sphingomonas sp. CFBP 13720]